MNSAATLFRRLVEFFVRTIRYARQPLTPVTSHHGQNHSLTIHIDVTRIAENDIGTGVQRVVRQISRHWLQSQKRTARLNFVRVNQKGELVDARSWTNQLVGQVSASQVEEPKTTLFSGDQLFLLDLVLPPRGLNKRSLGHLQRGGVKVVYMIYDILPLSHPHFFPFISRQLFRWWFRKAMSADQIVAISESTKQAVFDFVEKQRGAESASPPISVIPMSGEPEARIFERKTASRNPLNKPGGKLFVCVGTVEPRKGYDEVIGTFERLWENDSSDNLWIFGRPGWKTQQLQKRMRHQESENSRFRWIPEADDQVVQDALRLADALIAGSYAEGSGLPLLEARAAGIPVLARDIEVFREIADGEVYFFSNESDAFNLDGLLEHWDDRKPGITRDSFSKQCLWRDSVKTLDEIFTGRKTASGSA